MGLEGGREKVLILVKALPHVGDRHGETVCCAGVTENLEWRRQFPVAFRHLPTNRRFTRWQWIDYRWRRPTNDLRPESRRVQEDSIAVLGKLPEKERAPFLAPLITTSTAAAAAIGLTLTLIRPRQPIFHWKKKGKSRVERQRREYEAAAAQMSFLSDGMPVLDPCPYEFNFTYRDEDSENTHTSTCDDWETAAAFYRFQRLYGEQRALNTLEQKYSQYAKAGLVFAMGTHSRYPNTWLLVGVIRLNSVDQLSLQL